MTTVTFNSLDYTLLPQPHNWAFAPEWTLQWERVVETALQGQEDRADFRRGAKGIFKWSISPDLVADWSELETDLGAALLSGRAAVPNWTRPSVALTVAGNVVTLDPAGLLWVGAGPDDEPFSYTAFAQTTAGLWAVLTVASYDAPSGTLVLTGTMPTGFAVGDALFPLLFGRVEVNRDDLQTSRQGDLNLVLNVPQAVILPPYVPPAPTIELTVWAAGVVVTRSFYQGTPGDAHTFNCDLCVDGVLQPGQIALYDSTWTAPGDAELLEFFIEGARVHAYALP